MTTMEDNDLVVGYTFEDVERMADDVMKQCPIRPSVGIICGTGLDGLAQVVTDAISIPYAEIPGFPVCTVEGHEGKFVVGHISGNPVLLMVGRFHYYEGYPMWKVTLPVRVMRAMGIQTLVVTNAAGALNPEYRLGDVMVIKDHIDLPGLTGQNVLRGKNDERFGPRFLATNSIYDSELRQRFIQVAEELGHSQRIREGVYAMESGPTFITITEVKFLRMLGVDATGMSTIPEAIVGKHGGMKVFAFSFIADLETLDESQKVELTHHQVLEMAHKNAKFLQEIMQRFVSTLK